MANDDRYAQIEERFRQRTEQRDAELGEIREAIAVLESATGATAREIERLSAIKPPGYVTVLAVALTAAGLVGGGLAYLLNASLEPLRERILAVDHRQEKQLEHLQKLDDRQDRDGRTLQEMKGRFGEVEEQVDAIDSQGSRTKRD
jgi:hypothetical protein